MSDTDAPKKPNILITGTPGTGKTMTGECFFASPRALRFCRATQVPRVWSTPPPPSQSPLATIARATAEQIAETLGAKYINVGDLVKSRGLHEGHNEEWDTYILDEDKVKCATAPVCPPPSSPTATIAPRAPQPLGRLDNSHCPSLCARPLLRLLRCIVHFLCSFNSRVRRHRFFPGTD
jgi:hypothetical protein